MFRADVRVVVGFMDGMIGERGGRKAVVPFVPDVLSFSVREVLAERTALSALWKGTLTCGVTAWDSVLP